MSYNTNSHKIVTTVVFLVRVSYPRYCQTTDAYLGQGSRIDEAFDTYNEATEYIAANYNPHEDFDSDYYAYVTMDVTSDREGITLNRERTMSELHANSYYTGPATGWEDAPF